MTEETVLVREFSRAGPCLTLGRLVRETNRFWVYQPWRGGNQYDLECRRVAKPSDRRYSPVHIVACRSCRDHAETSYPNGYMD